MIHSYNISTIFLGFLFIGLSPFSATAATSSASSAHAVSYSRYSKAHSLGNHYVFNEQNGWQSANVSNSRYKYTRDIHFSPNKTDLTPEKIRGKNAPKSTDPKSKSTIGGTIKKIFGALKGIGTFQTVKVTWYTGHDLQNPSCWSKAGWAPTDEALVSAVTEHGWEKRPKCFEFLEVCNTPKKCVFVRVVDSCGGCAPGSKHIDLTRAAFRLLADLDVGTLEVQFRPATAPLYWLSKLWGPQHTH